MRLFIKTWNFECVDCDDIVSISCVEVYPDDVLKYKQPKAPRCYNASKHKQTFRKFKIRKFVNASFAEDTGDVMVPRTEEDLQAIVVDAWCNKMKRQRTADKD